MHGVARRALLVVALLLGSVAAASPLDRLAIGTPLASIERLVGPALAQGGPDSPSALQFELTGPVAAEITGASDKPVYLVFEKPQGRKEFVLTYLTWSMSVEQEMALLGQQPAQPASVRCLRSGPYGRLAVRDSKTSWQREAVLEASASFKSQHGIQGRQMRPFYSEVCHDGPK
jgi:hypothetical protein